MFNLTGDKKIWYFILGVIVILHLSSVFTNTNSLIGFVLMGIISGMFQLQ